MPPVIVPTLLLLAVSSRAFAAGGAPPPVLWTVRSADVTVHLDADPAGSAPTLDLTYIFERVGDADAQAGSAWATLRLVDGVLPRGSSLDSPTSAVFTRDAANSMDASGDASGASGTFVTLDPARRSVTVKLTGLVQTDGPSHALVHLAAAPFTRVHLDAPGLDVEVAGSLPDPDRDYLDDPCACCGTRLLRPDGVLDLRWQPHRESVPAPASSVVRAELSTAAWVRDGALGVRSRVRFIVSRGSVQQLQLDVAGLEDVELEGVPFTRSGSILTLTPADPLDGMLTVELTGRRSAISGGFPSPKPLGVARVESWYTLGKPDEGDVVPSGGAAVSARQLPLWARGVSESTPVAYWSTRAPSLAAGHFETIMGPDTVVQAVEYVVSQSEDGHVLARATWLVRNERSQYLKVTPPPGLRPLTVRVSGRPALILKEGDSFYVPLEKSIETVQGLLAFPVEVAWIGTDVGWLSPGPARKQTRVLTLPAVDAPIQAAKWEVHLPRGWKLDGHPSRHSAKVSGAARGPAAARSGGPAAARSGGHAGSKLDAAKEQSREAWTNAIDAYKENDFEGAQRWLDASRGYADQTVEKDAATMDNVGRLQSNLDVLLQPAQPSTTLSSAGLSASGESSVRAAEDDVLARRVRDLANAKTTDAQLAQGRLEEDARKAILAGDDAGAAVALEQVTALAKDIGVTEQRESNEQADKLEMYGQVLNETRARSQSAAVVAGGKAQSETRGRAPGRAGSSGIPTGRSYQEAVGQAVGVLSGSSSGAAALPAAKPVAAPEERSYELADEAVTDPVTGTFSENFNFDAVEGLADADAREPEVADAEQELSPEFLTRIPSGRSYQSVVAVTAGVVASTPAPTEPVMRPVTQGIPVSGRAKAGEATAPRQKVAPGPDVMDFETGVSGGFDISGPDWDGDVDGYENAKKAKQAAPKKEDQKPEVRSISRPDAPLNRADELNAEREREQQRAQSLALASRAKANRNLAPDTRVRRSALSVDASPLTPALPLDGALVTHTAALLEAGEFPSFSYSVIADPRSESFKE